MGSASNRAPFFCPELVECTMPIETKLLVIAIVALIGALVDAYLTLRK
jgi:hypothetical protein